MATIFIIAGLRDVAAGVRELEVSWCVTEGRAVGLHREALTMRGPH